MKFASTLVQRAAKGLRLGLRKDKPSRAARYKRLLLSGAAAISLFALAALAYALSLPFPEALRTPVEPSLRVLDRHGQLLATVRRDGELRQHVALEEVEEIVVPALLAAEDARFWHHPGIDPLAIARAAGQAVVEGRVVSGASTITQQLARSTFDRPRTLGGKLYEMALAVRIERQWSKRQILEAYLNRIYFGPNLRGVQAASLHYFDKPAWALSLAEAATLVATVRGPTLYDPQRNPDRVRERRDWILERMQAAGLAEDAQIERALKQPLELFEGRVWPGAHHWVRAMVQSRRGSGTAAPSDIVTTLDAALQRRVEALTRAHAASIREFGASAAAVVVVDNRRRELLAYVGSPDYFDEPHAGQVDGARALRQPGSTLKPFVYATAMAELEFTAATILPDIELRLREGEQVYQPRNYDGQLHGPVRLREALANSFNIPAVYTAARVGPERVLATLRRAGFTSLRESAEYYGAALALGDGEVTLKELAAAYATLANRGRYAPLRHLRGEKLDATKGPHGHTRIKKHHGAERQAIDPEIAAILTDILADPAARASAFGRHSPLELPFEVAAKTGTSKGHRDNWTVGYTREITVAVWVGNFDGTPMRGASGVSGAGPLFHDVMREAMRGRSPLPLRPTDHAKLARVEVCALSGKLPTELCSKRLNEVFRPRLVPSEREDFHARVFIDPHNGLLAHEACPGAEPRVVEQYPLRFLNWAIAANRPIAPAEPSPRCKIQAAAETQTAPRITFPTAGTTFELLHHGASAGQQLVLTAQSAAGARITFVINGRSLEPVRAPFERTWPLARGHHELIALDEAGRASEPVSFSVR